MIFIVRKVTNGESSFDISIITNNLKNTTVLCEEIISNYITGFAKPRLS